MENLEKLTSACKPALRCIDMAYLIKHTKSNPKLMMEVISVYLKQTIPLIKVMKQSLDNKDWDTLQATMHKVIPSFLIMGISRDYENMARKIQDYANNKQHIDKIPSLVLQLENVLTQACNELQEEFDTIKNAQL